MLKFNYKGRTVAYMPLDEATTVPQVKAARSLAAGMAGTYVHRITIIRPING